MYALTVYQRAVKIIARIRTTVNLRFMNARLTMVYWKSKKFWLGKLIEHPEIMTQGRTLKELEENIRDAYRMMVLEDVPEKHQFKEVVV